MVGFKSTIIMGVDKVGMDNIFSNWVSFWSVSRTRYSIS